MAASKLSVFLITVLLFSCGPQNSQVISEWRDGTTRRERIYSDTLNTFIEKTYYDNGQLESETKFIDSIENGESISYYKDGKLSSKCIYRNGKINGEVTEFHKSGSIMFKGTQADGNLVGTATHYYPTGKPETELYYRDGKLLLVHYWDSTNNRQIINGNGQKDFKEFLVKSREGYDTIINVRAVGAYKDSVYNGVWKYYSLVDNKLILERNFENNRITAETWK